MSIGGVQPAEIPSDQAAEAQEPKPAAQEPKPLAQLFFELQQLQTEVQVLRGQLEDQSHELERLRTLQRQQYLDIDARLAGSTATVPEALPEAVAIEPPQPAAAITGAQTGNSTEQDRYSIAFELMKNQEFGRSIAAFQATLNDYPTGTYAANSRYWLGELYLMQDKLDDAQDAFMKVTRQYPAHQKVPDSLYKLGVVHHRLGSTPTALRYFDDVVNRYPGTPAAGLARTYAAELR
jgi:tol-pal system protein YbgF